MALRDAVFAEGASLFDPGRLAYGFVNGSGFQFDPVVVDRWRLDPSRALGSVEWIVPMATTLLGFNLLDPGRRGFIEFISFRDENGDPDTVRLLAGMVLGYTHEVLLVDA